MQTDLTTSKSKTQFTPYISRLILIIPGFFVAWLVYEGWNFVPELICEQGAGWDILLPFMDQWKEYRANAYSIAIFILIILGLATMLQKKLTPGTKLEAERKINYGPEDESRPFAIGNLTKKIAESGPKYVPILVLYLAITTFSYTIAALVLDIRNVIMCVIERI